MGCALVLTPDGGISEIDLPSETHAVLEALYKAIGCDAVDVVRLTTQLDMWVDDEGLFTQVPNPVATAFARRYGRTAQTYHGPAVITGVDGDGNTISLTAEQARGILTHLQDAAGTP
jgi:Domain of unknown function (DUF3846)